MTRQGEPDALPEQQDAADPWAGALPGRSLVPAYLVSRYAAQYRVIVDVLLAAQDGRLTGMSYEEVADAVERVLGERVGAEQAARLLAEPAYQLESRLAQLEAWRVVTHWQEPARRGEDFLRRRDRYQLAPLAARLHAFWVSADDAEEEAAGLTLAPRAIHQRLAAFADCLAAQDYPAAANEFQQVVAVHQAMARAARGWQRTLAHALAGSPDEAKQESMLQTLQSYVAMWGEQVDVHSPRIAQLLSRLDPVLTEPVWRACVRGGLADAPAEEVVRAQAERWVRTWQALGTWFAGPDGQARRLRRQLRDVVAPWARNMRILLDTGGAVTRRDELFALAGAIERAPDEETAWRIWDTAVGAFSARHLLLACDAAEDHGQSWQDGPRAPVTARFREHGQRAAVGRRARSADFSAGRAAARQHRAAAAAARAEAEARLRQRSGTRLSDWGQVDEAELSLLLELLGLARRQAPRPGQARPEHSAVTADGRLRVRLSAPADPAETTSLDSPRGTLVTLDWRFELEPAR